MSVKWIKPIGYWKYTFLHEDCAICRESLNHPAIGYESNRYEKRDDYFAVWKGKCNHVFHKYCIQKWLQTRYVCPLCNLPWEVQL